MRRPMDFWKGLVRPYYHLSKAVNLMAFRLHRHWHKASSSLHTCYSDVSFTYVSVSFMEKYHHETFQGYQGQFTLPLAYQGVSKYAWQTVGQSTVFVQLSIVISLSLGNAISLVTGVIAGSLFSHVSTRVLYINFVEGLGGPRLLTPKGRVVWGSTCLPHS